MYEDLREQGFDFGFVKFMEKMYDEERPSTQIINKMHLAYLQGHNAGMYLGLKFGREEGYESGVAAAHLGIE
jgi:hypothetical protein